MLYFQFSGFFVRTFTIIDIMCISLSGEILISQKHRKASKFIYNFAFYITTNVYSDFVEELDGQAIKTRFKHKIPAWQVNSAFMMNQYISEVVLEHLQHERQTLCDNG